MLILLRTHNRFLSTLTAIIFMSVNFTCLAEGKKEETWDYPIFAKEHKGMTPEQIEKKLWPKAVNELEFEELMDLIFSRSYLRMYDQASRTVEHGLSEFDDKEKRADLHIMKASIYTLVANEEEEEAKRQELYKKAIPPIKKAVQSRSTDVKLAKNYLAIALNAGDKLEAMIAKDLVKRIDPDLAGKEVLDPVTGIVIIAIGVIGVSTYAYMTDNKETISKLPAILAIATAAITAIKHSSN